MKPGDIAELYLHKYLLALGADALKAFTDIECWSAARETLTQLDQHLRQIELIELREKQESKSSRDAATPREP